MAKDVVALISSGDCFVADISFWCRQAYNLVELCYRRDSGLAAPARNGRAII